METFGNETFWDPGNVTKADLLVAIGSFEVKNLWLKIFSFFLNHEMLTLLIWKLTVTEIISIKSNLEIDHNYVIETVLWVVLCIRLRGVFISNIKPLLL